ncbi:MAG: septum formation protein Maf [Acetobacteraceae bacterium]|nr:septum formation protein Maf [Acetobacteraceae bacterium]
MEHPAPRLILASQSPTRARLLASAGLRFETKPARIDEDAVKQAAQAEDASAAEAALLLADMKAQRAGAGDGTALVIGADQILVCDERWFSKSQDGAEARAQLLTLRGRPHELVTAVVCHRDGRRVWHHVATPRLLVRHFSETFLDEYIAAEGDALTDSVGGYRLEGAGIQLFDRVEGDYFSVLGLPLFPLLGFLRQHGALAT